MITLTITPTGPAFETVYRGTSYYMRRDTIGRIEVRSNRLAMSTMGSVRHYATLDDVERDIKAFRGLVALVPSLTTEVAA